jgi:hypothetical protein
VELKKETDMADEPVKNDVDDEPLEAAGIKALEAERKARKAAEKQLAALGGRVEALQRAEVERIAGQQAGDYRPLADPSDLWRADGVELGALLNEVGDIDPDRVRATVGGVLEARPHWAVRQPPASGSGDGGKGAPAEPSMDTIAEKLIRGRR